MKHKYSPVLYVSSAGSALIKETSSKATKPANAMATSWMSGD